MTDANRMIDHASTAVETGVRPVLHLSGPKLRGGLDNLISAAEVVGGVERFAEAVKLKGQVFQERLGEGRAETLERAAFEEIVPLMPTVRRRIGKVIEAHGWPHVRSAIVALLHDAHVPGTADNRIAKFERALSPPTPNPSPRHGEAAPSARGGGESERARREANGRFIRDLAAELLHGVYPEHHPLMTRWVWDTKANTGVLREIWHDPVAGDDVDRIVIDIADKHETFLVLREELSQFLSDNGIFRDMLWYVDLLQAQIYGDYINAQGGAWLKTEFGSETNPLEHTRRILGLDRVAGRNQRSAIDGERHGGLLSTAGPRS